MGDAKSAVAVKRKGACILHHACQFRKETRIPFLSIHSKGCSTELRLDQKPEKFPKSLLGIPRRRRCAFAKSLTSSGTLNASN